MTRDEQDRLSGRGGRRAVAQRASPDRDKAVIDLCMAILEGFYAAAYDGPAAGNSVSRASFQAVSSGA